MSSIGSTQKKQLGNNQFFPAISGTSGVESNIDNLQTAQFIKTSTASLNPNHPGGIATSITRTHDGVLSQDKEILGSTLREMNVSITTHTVNQGMHFINNIDSQSNSHTIVVGQNKEDYLKRTASKNESNEGIYKSKDKSSSRQTVKNNQNSRFVRQESSDKLIGVQSEKHHNDEIANQQKGIQNMSKKLDKSKTELYQQKEDFCEEQIKEKNNVVLVKDEEDTKRQLKQQIIDGSSQGGHCNGKMCAQPQSTVSIQEENLTEKKKRINQLFGSLFALLASGESIFSYFNSYDSSAHTELAVFVGLLSILSVICIGIIISSLLRYFRTPSSDKQTKTLLFFSSEFFQILIILAIHILYFEATLLAIRHYSVSEELELLSFKVINFLTFTVLFSVSNKLKIILQIYLISRLLIRCDRFSDNAFQIPLLIIFGIAILWQMSYGQELSTIAKFSDKQKNLSKQSSTNNKNAHDNVLNPLRSSSEKSPDEIVPISGEPRRILPKTSQVKLLEIDSNHGGLVNKQQNGSMSYYNTSIQTSTHNQLGNGSTGAKTASQHLISSVTQNNSSRFLKHSLSNLLQSNHTNNNTINNNNNNNQNLNFIKSSSVTLIGPFSQNNGNLIESRNSFDPKEDLINMNYPLLRGNDGHEKQQMSKISELDLENELSKQNNYINSQQQIIANPQNPLTDVNQKLSIPLIQSQTNPSSTTFEKKTLIDQLIEVDGIVVFESTTQAVVYTNQNILSLFDTDASHILQEVQLLKHIPFDEKTSREDFSISNFLKYVLKDSGNIVNQQAPSPLLNPSNNASKMSKAGSNTQLNEVIEEEENEQDLNPKSFPVKKIPSSSDKQFVSQGMQQDSNSNNNNYTNRSSESPLHGAAIGTKKLSFLTMNNSINYMKERRQSMPKSRTHNLKSSNSPFISPSSENAPVDEEAKARNKRTESIFKTLPPQFSSNSNNKLEVSSVGDIFCQAPLQPAEQHPSFLQNRIHRDSLDQQFPSYLSSIQFPARKSTQLGVGSNNNNTIDRERTSTLKELIDEVRSKSSTMFAEKRKNTISGKKKTLAPRRAVSYSMLPEVIAGNMVLFKENSNRVFLAKYSVAEHASKMLHILTIRDLSGDIFEQILERQSVSLVEELYAHLRGSEVESSLHKALILSKGLKAKLEKTEYKTIIVPLRAQLRIFKNVVGDVFDVRALQQRNFYLNKEYFDLEGELLKVKKTVEQCSETIISFYFDKKIPVRVRNDKDRLGQILMNLLLCASQLGTRKVLFLRAKLTKDENFVKLSVNNTDVSDTHKSLALKAAPQQVGPPNQTPPHNYLAYHFFVSNLLAIQLSNNKQRLQVLSKNAQTLKLKFSLCLFPPQADSPSKVVQLNQSKLNNQDSPSKQYTDSPSKFHIDSDRRKQSDQIDQEMEDQLDFQNNNLGELEEIEGSERGGEALAQTIEDVHLRFPVRFIKDLYTS